MSLEAVDVTAGYQGTGDVVRGLSLSVQPSEVLGLTGPSGSGKSTLARVLALLLKPRAGSVVLDGIAVRGVGYSVSGNVRGQIAMLFQSPRAATDPRMTLRAVIEQPAVIAGRQIDVGELAAQVGLTPDLMKRRPHEVSDGQLQRACVARALAQNPKYLICDEATAMLDSASTASILRLVRARALETGVGVLMISHDTELLDVVCNRVERIG